MKKILCLILLIILNSSINQAGESIVLQAAKKEMNRFMTGLKDQANPPYFIGYGITDTRNISISGSFGKIISNSDDFDRTLDIDLRIGDYKFDNTHIIRGESFSFGFRQGAASLPIENDEASLRNAIWFATDKAYKDGVEKYQKALTNNAVKVKQEDTSADFSMESPSNFSEPDVEMNFDKTLWENRIKNVSAIFAKYDWLYTGYVNVSLSKKRKYFINSEGTEIVMTEPYVRIFISAKTKADDGMSLPLYKSYFAYDPKDLPDEKELTEAAMNLINILDKMRKAPLMSTYSGPALLSGEASGVFFHEIFGHRVEGERLKNPDDAQTFKNSIGLEVLPNFINVIFDPTVKEIRGNEISGYYAYDDEGVKSQRVDVVKNGIFKNFLMSRSPIENFDKSNGHGRRQAGYDAASRQSNLIVSTTKEIPVDELREKLKEECKIQGKDFGLLFEKVQGGFTFTGRTIPNSFNVNPLLVYKVFVDGRPDEIVRGVDLIGTPLTTFSNIIEAGNDIGVFNGTCGAESGAVSVSACSPTLLVKKIEVQKKSKSQAKLPILPAPFEENQ